MGNRKYKEFSSSEVGKVSIAAEEYVNFTSSADGMDSGLVYDVLDDDEYYEGSDYSDINKWNPETRARFIDLLRDSEQDVLAGNARPIEELWDGLRVEYPWLNI